MADNTLRGSTVVETIRNVVEHYFGDDVEVPDDVISAILVLAGNLENILDPDDLQQYIDDWLDAHPEATTTVQDGSITDPKLADGLIGSISNDEVTAMFGE